MDMFVVAGITAREVQERLNAVLPEGLRILESEEVDAKSPSISTLINATLYRITLTGIDPNDLLEQCVQFLAHNTFVIQRTKKGETRTIDLKGETVSLTAEGQTVSLVAKRGKPLEFMKAITGNEALNGDDIQVDKLEVIFKPES
jgi:radical SAM-linked protein